MAPIVICRGRPAPAWNNPSRHALSSGRSSLIAMLHTVADFDFALPPELIAQHPAPERSASRLLDGRGAAPADCVFRDLPALLDAGDLLVFNDTRVIKARLYGRKASGGAVEALVDKAILRGYTAAGPPEAIP
jgi:S-adenosylmethionine:tRNA ribosyltransferase-isomerase